MQAHSNTSEKEADDHHVLINGPTKFEMTSQITGLTLNWEYDNFEIKSITAWSHQDDIGIVGHCQPDLGLRHDGGAR